MTGLNREDFRSWLETSKDTTTAVNGAKDMKLSLSSHLLRTVWGGRHTLAVSSNASSEVQIGALLDLLAWHSSDPIADGADPGRVALLLNSGVSDEVRDALRSIRKARRRHRRDRVHDSRPKRG